MKTIKCLILLGIAALAIAFAYIYAGLYPIGADVPHNKATHWLLATLRERSIARAAADIQVPELNDAQLLLSGGPDYNEMCAPCHLKPGRKQSDMSLGLYPSPPNLSLSVDDHLHAHGAGDDSASVRRQFWIIKHGIKASGMPAWGPTHDDQRIWAMVAFIQKLPSLTPEQYRILTARAPGENSHH